MKLKFALLALMCLTVFVGARPMLRGYALGSVLSVDTRAGEVSVDLGSRDYALKGFEFVAVDGQGNPIANIKAREVYDDRFWSEKLTPDELASVRPGMQVRWLFTPEIISLLTAKKSGKAEAYIKYFTKYPDSKYLPDAVRELPDGLLRELNPDYLAARKKYTKEAFQEILAKYPGTAYAAAAESELYSLGEYDRDQAKLKAEREKRNAEAEAESKRQGAVLERANQARESSGLEPLGKLVNNSSDTVLFVFKEPAEVPQTTVSPSSFASVRLPVGTFSYDVFKVAATAVGFPDEKRQPVKSGDVTVMGNFWEAVYP